MLMDTQDTQTSIQKFFLIPNGCKGLPRLQLDVQKKEGPIEIRPGADFTRLAVHLFSFCTREPKNGTFLGFVEYFLHRPGQNSTRTVQKILKNVQKMLFGGQKLSHM